MGFRYEHPTKLIGEVNNGGKHREWYLVYRELKFGDFDEDLGAGWNIKYPNKKKIHNKHIFTLSLSTAQSSQYDRTIGHSDEDPEIIPDDVYYYDKLKRFYNKNIKVDRITLECNIKVPSVKQQPKLYEFLLPNIWEKYGIYKGCNGKSRKFILKYNKLKSLLINHHLGGEDAYSEIESRKAELDLLRSDFYRDYETIFRDMREYVTRMDMAPHLFRAGFMLSIKILTNFARRLCCIDRQNIDVVEVLYNLFPSGRLSPTGKTYLRADILRDESKLGEYEDDESIRKTKKALKADIGKYGTGTIIDYKTYCSEWEKLKNEVIMLVKNKEYNELQNLIIKHAIEEFNMFKLAFFGEKPIIKDALHSLLYNIFESIAEDVSRSDFAFRCAGCGDIVYKEGRRWKYCSDACRSRHNSRKDYSEHRAKRLKAKQRKTTKKKRKLARTR